MRKLWDRRELFLLAAIVVFGLVLRVWQLGTTPLWIDESISSVVADKIAHHGVPVLDSGMFYSRALLYHYVEAFFLLIFGMNDTAARLASVLFGTLTVLLAYYMGKEFGKPTGLVAALLCSALYLEVLYSRQARFYQLFQLLFFFTIYCLYKSKNSKKYAWLACIALVLCVQTQTAGLVLVPFVLLAFWNEHKHDKALFVLPVLTAAYFGAGFLGLSLGTSLAGTYVEHYSSVIYDSLAGFLFISLGGMVPAFRNNRRLFLFVLLPSVLLCVGLLFVKVFALRYLYCVVFALVLLCANLFAYIYEHNKVLFVIALVFALVYPSNFVFADGYFTVVLPTEVHTTSLSEPIIDYKNLNSTTKELILRNDTQIVTLSTPGVEWYLKRPDYFVPFSLNGLKNGYALYGNVDAYTGAKEFESPGVLGKFVLLEDAFGASKLDAQNRQMLNTTKQECVVVQRTYGLNVYNCNNNV